MRLNYLVEVGVLSDDFSLQHLILERQESIGWWSLFLYPLFLTLKVLGIACIIDTGFTLFHKKTSFQHLLLAVILSEYVYLFPDLIKLIWSNQWLENPYLPYLSYSPFNLFHSAQAPFLLKYLCNTFNLFEILYILFLSFALSSLQASKFLNSCFMVIKTYGVFLLAWSLCIGLFLNNIIHP